jgi:uncharacterized surface protein with fasciclin (FAS1) repeats
MMNNKTLPFLALLLSFGLVAAACGDDATEVVDDATDAAAEAVDEVAEGAEEVAEDAGEMAEDMADDAGEMADDMADDAEDMVDEMTEPATVVDIAVSDENFSTLVAAVTEAGLVETLQGEGPFTVFAPTNDAFAALLTELDITAEDLLAREDLADILTYHVVAGEIMAADAIAADGTEVETVNGDTIEVSVVDGDVMIDGATVTTADLKAGNGVVHVIDTVILPG